jgi:S-adenosyl methyltransferase
VLDHLRRAHTYIDMDTPNAARIYDYLLGGACNSAADREMARRIVAAMPEAPHVTRVNRAFLRRSVRFLVDSGIRQFIDIGSGIPTAGNVHEVAQRMDPGCRVVYVDRESVAVVHSQLLLQDNELADVVHADVREPADVLTAPEVTALIDFDEPVGLLMFALLHHVPDNAEPAALLAVYRDVLSSGSYLALSHVTDEGVSDHILAAHELYTANSTPVTLRNRAEIARLVDGFDPVDPGIVYVPMWRPDCPEDSQYPEEAAIYGVVARKP